MKTEKNSSVVHSLQKIIEITHKRKKIHIEEIFTLLAGKDYSVLLIICSFPFCLPIQIPAVSTPFGILLAFLGLRLIFFKHLWWPQFLLRKSLKASHIRGFATKALSVIKILQKVTHPRLTILTHHPFLHKLHGLLIFILGLILSLPLPIPFTNLLSAIPLLLLGIGLLEEDGIVIILAYCLAALAGIALIALFVWGETELHHLLQKRAS